MTLALNELPNDVALLKQLIVEQQAERDALILRIREEAAAQLEAERAARQAAIDAAKASDAARSQLVGLALGYGGLIVGYADGTTRFVSSPKEEAVLSPFFPDPDRTAKRPNAER